MRESVANRPVLVVGLDPFRVPGPWDPAPVAEAIEAGMTDLADRGYDAQSCLVGIDGSEDAEAHVRQALVARSWACVVIGGGIRKDEDLLLLFESVVNLVRRLAPGASIAFNSTPHDLSDAVARGVEGGADG